MMINKSILKNFYSPPYFPNYDIKKIFESEIR